MPQYFLKLTGPFVDQTVILNGHKFVEGKCPIDLKQDEGVITYFEKCYQAQVVTEEEPNVKTETKTTEKVDEGEVNEKLLAAVLSLDPDNDAHWTQDGKPAIAAVVESYGSNDVKRADINLVVPDYDREAARVRKDTAV